MYELEIYFDCRETIWLKVTRETLNNFRNYIDDDAISDVIEIKCEEGDRVVGVNRKKVHSYAFKEVSEWRAF